ncbi:RNA-binding protein 12B [Folsomia candida]|uniref:RNA-binding protein 12B n=1 Tax=Folsomia candida TaxID=158441 RepID=A0A226E7D0_FOLCA|nr:RNA-binding protein 12B [Folsomia candida]
MTKGLNCGLITCTFVIFLYFNQCILAQKRTDQNFRNQGDKRVSYVSTYQPSPNRRDGGMDLANLKFPDSVYAQDGASSSPGDSVSITHYSDSDLSMHVDNSLPELMKTAPPPTIDNNPAPPMESYEVPPMENYAAPAPPMQNYAAPPMENYAAPPMQNYAAPPMENYAAPPMQNYAAPPMQNYAAPPMQSYAAPPMQNYGAAPPPPPHSQSYGAPAPTKSTIKKKFTKKSLAILFGMALIMVWVLFRTTYFRQAGVAGFYHNGRSSVSRYWDYWNNYAPDLASSAWDLEALSEKVLTLLEEVKLE